MCTKHLSESDLGTHSSPVVHQDTRQSDGSHQPSNRKHRGLCVQSPCSSPSGMGVNSSCARFHCTCFSISSGERSCHSPSEWYEYGATARQMVRVRRHSKANGTSTAPHQGVSRFGKGRGRVVVLSAVGSEQRAVSVPTGIPHHSGASRVVRERSCERGHERPVPSDCAVAGNSLSVNTAQPEHTLAAQQFNTRRE